METTEQTVTVPLSELIALRDRFNEISRACAEEANSKTGQVDRADSGGKAYAFSSAAGYVTMLIHEHEPQS